MNRLIHKDRSLPQLVVWSRENDVVRCGEHVIFQTNCVPPRTAANLLIACTNKYSLVPSASLMIKNVVVHGKLCIELLATAAVPAVIPLCGHSSKLSTDPTPTCVFPQSLFLGKFCCLFWLLNLFRCDEKLTTMTPAATVQHPAVYVFLTWLEGAKSRGKRV